MLHDTPGGTPPPPAARPTLDLLDALAPDDEDVRELAAEAGFDEPAWEVRREADRTAAAWIALHLRPDDPPADRAAALDGLEEEAVAAALPLCRAAHERFRLLRVARDGHRALLAAGPATPRAALEAATARLAAAHRAAAEASVEAALAACRAHGVARAVRFARRGEPWIDPEVEAEADEIFGRRSPPTPLTPRGPP